MTRWYVVRTGQFEATLPAGDARKAARAAALHVRRPLDHISSVSVRDTEELVPTELWR